MKWIATTAMLLIAAFPAWAEDCTQASVVERKLAHETVAPYTAPIRPVRSDQEWTIGPAGGGFIVPAPPMGEIVAIDEGVSTSCGLKIGWRSYWGGARITAATDFRVVEIQSVPIPRRTSILRAASFSIEPDQATQTARLSVTSGGRTYEFLVGFPATAIATYPTMHTDTVTVKLAGVRADGALMLAEFSGPPPR